MAKAKHTKVQIVKEVPGVELTLTEGEVDFLLAILSRIGGSPDKSPRKYAGAIRSALSSLTGTDYRKTDAHPLSDGHIRFSDYGTAVKPNSDRSAARSGYFTGHLTYPWYSYSPPRS